jgi:hypothetical protein
VKAAPVWAGTHGTVVLGPTEDRVARYLAERTRYGQVTLRTVDLVTALHLERSEAYRITARLRVLGLFGIANDRGGHAGGRRVWRTPTARGGSGLDRPRHRMAWARITAAARAKLRAVMAKVADLHQRPQGAGHGPGETRPAPDQIRLPVGDGAAQHPPGTGIPSPVPGETFAQRMRRYGLGGLLDTWGVE